jgi:hypothetical protein
MTTAIWVPGAAGPLDELVVRLRRMVETFAQERGLEQAEVRVELVDGRELVVTAITAEPGFGFLTLVPHADGENGARQVIVPIGAVKLVEISALDPEHAIGFADQAR